MTLQDLLDKVITYNSKADFDLIKKAFYYAKEAHGDQMRISGEEWMQHPLNTADRLADCELDSALIAAALLHDVVEDTPRTLKDIEKNFGKEVALLVNGVTKVSAVKYHGDRRHLEKLQNLFLFLADDPRVILLKLADRLHNLNTLEALSWPERKRIAEESLTVFTPLADRLGLGYLRGEMEDLAFRHAHPQEYQWIKKIAEARTRQKLPYLKKIQNQLEKKLKQAGIKVLDIHLRAKYYYSLYNKLLLFNSDIDRIYDLNVIRIIVKEEKDCYAALGVIHEIWHPLKGHIKDYIARPKGNGYQSLHTTVMTKPDLVEFQIKTEPMHQMAENGLAFLYANNKIKEINNFPLIKEIRKLRYEFRDAKKYLDILKTDVFQKHITVFTPHGDVITLPEEATPIDFAYKIHTDIGHQAQQAKINDKMVPLQTKLKSGDIVTIITDAKRCLPDKEWLKMAKTGYARYYIRKALTK